MAGKVGVSPGTTTLTIPGYGAIALGDWIDDRHWSVVQLQDGQTDSLSAFSTGRSQQMIGGTRQNTLMDTNQPSNGVTGLPLSWEFFVYGLAIDFVRATRPDQGQDQPRNLNSFSDPLRYQTFFQINRRVFCRYRYNSKMYSEGYIVDYPAGTGVWLFSTQAATETANNGVPSPRDRNALVLPIHEEELLGYEMEITPVVALAIAQAASDDGDALNFVDLRVQKNGLIKRTVV
jgi:hypothetical protein